MTFSTASTMPSRQRMPIEVPPFSTALTAYSTWKLRPSGEKMELARSYPVPIDVWPKRELSKLESPRGELMSIDLPLWLCAFSYVRLANSGWEQRTGGIESWLVGASRRI